MLRRYYRLLDDMLIPKRWELGNCLDEQGREIDDRRFMRVEPVSVEGTIHIPIRRMGRRLDFSFLVSGPAPVVTEKLADVFRTLARDDVEFFPATVDGQTGRYYVINVRKLVKCIDDERSQEVEYWAPEDGIPEKVGQYASVYGMRVDPSRIGDEKVFRTWGWRVALVVAEEIKDAMERVGCFGARFIPV